MRLFTALDLPSSVRDQCAALQEQIDLDGRWTDPTQFHVTVRFIGDVDDRQVRRYETALSSLQQAPARCVPYGLDALPSRQNPSVLVVGLERTDSLLALHDAVSEALATEGLAPEDRKYRPHVTLARLADADATDVHDAIASHGDAGPSSFTAEAVHLYESTLTPDGAVHDHRQSVPLRG